jgi:hypothetical protein
MARYRRFLQDLPANSKQRWIHRSSLASELASSMTNDYGDRTAEHSHTALPSSPFISLIIIIIIIIL